MEFLIELLLDLIFEGSVEISSNKKVSKWIRYPLIILIILLFIIVIFVIFILGVKLLKEFIFLGTLFIGISIIMVIMGINKFRKLYVEKNENDNL